MGEARHLHRQFLEVLSMNLFCEDFGCGLSRPDVQSPLSKHIGSSHHGARVPVGDRYLLPRWGYIVCADHSGADKIGFRVWLVLREEIHAWLKLLVRTAGEKGLTLLGRQFSKEVRLIRPSSGLTPWWSWRRLVRSRSGASLDGSVARVSLSGVRFVSGLLRSHRDLGSVGIDRYRHTAR